MRIAICTRQADLTSVAGQGLAILRQAEAMRDLGAEVLLLAAAPGPSMGVSPFSMGGVQGTAITGPTPQTRQALEALTLASPRGMGEWHDLTIGRYARRELERFQPQALLLHGLSPWGVTALRVCAARAIPFAIVERSNLVARRMRSPAGLGRFYNACARGSRAIFVADRLVRQRLGRDMGLENLVTLRDGGAIGSLDAREVARPDRWFGRRLIVSPGPETLGGSYDTLLEGFARANLPGTTLVTIGEQPQRSLAAARRRGLEDRIDAIPVPGLEGLSRMLAWTDLFVMPGWCEGAGALTAEAMGAGAPTLMAGDTPLAPDVEEGVHAWTFAAGDAAALGERLRHAFAAPNVAGVGLAGRELIRERFSWTRNAQRLLYEMDLLRTGAAAPMVAA